MKLKKIKIDLKFNPKRNNKLITPCCNRSNKDGKFINYIGLSDAYGYCHSCGVSTFPPTLYQDKFDEKYIWNDTLNKFEKLLEFTDTYPNKINKQEDLETKFINPNIIKDSISYKPENNLIKYLRKTFGYQVTDKIISSYFLGSDKNGWNIFWYIDKNLMARKSKVIEYNSNGKRTSKIKSPYLNKFGYKACLFGEHLLKEVNKEKDIIVLVESEKTAIIGAINLPNYWWLAYSGINGLTNSKLEPLRGYRVLIIPDMSQNAVSIIHKKIPFMIEQGIRANIWDLTYGKTDEQLKIDNEYNNDIADILINIDHEN